MISTYLKGLALLQQNDSNKAAAEFQMILDNRNLCVLSVIYPLSMLQLGRAKRLSDEITESKKAYQDFLSLWKDADSDIPILIKARQEYDELLKSESR